MFNKGTLDIYVFICTPGMTRVKLLMHLGEDVKGTIRHLYVLPVYQFIVLLELLIIWEIKTVGKKSLHFEDAYFNAFVLPKHIVV